MAKAGLGFLRETGLCTEGRGGGENLRRQEVRQPAAEVAVLSICEHPGRGNLFLGGEARKGRERERFLPPGMASSVGNMSDPPAT